MLRPDSIFKLFLDEIVCASALTGGGGGAASCCRCGHRVRFINTEGAGSSGGDPGLAERAHLGYESFGQG